MKKLFLKEVPEEEVTQWILRMQRDRDKLETSFVVPKVIRQYTRKKKNPKVQSESVNKVSSALSATLSDQSHSEIKVENNVKMKDNAVTEMRILNFDLKEEPYNPTKIIEVNVSDSTNLNIDLDQNCSYSKVHDHIKKENISEINMNNTDTIPDQNKMTDQVKIKEENVSDITNQNIDSDQNCSYWKVHHHIKKENITEINMNNTKTIPDQNKMTDQVKIKEENVSDITNQNIDSDQNCSYWKVYHHHHHIKKENITEINTNNTDTIPDQNKLTDQVKIKEENVSDITNQNIDSDQNCSYWKVHHHIKKENITEINMNNTKTIPDQNKMTDQVKIKEENVSDITNQNIDSDQNCSYWKVYHHIKKENITEINMNNTNTIPDQHKMTDQVKIKEENVSNITNQNIDFDQNCSSSYWKVYDHIKKGNITKININNTDTIPDQNKMTDQVKIKEENVSDITNQNIDFDQNCSYWKVYHHIKKENVTDVNINNTDTIPDQNINSEMIDQVKIKEENVSDIKNLDIESDQNCLHNRVYHHIKREKVTELNMNNIDTIPDQNINNKMTEQVKLKEECIDTEDTNSDCTVNDMSVITDIHNHKNKISGQHMVMSDAMSLQAEANGTKADTEICNSVIPVKSNSQNEKLMNSVSNILSEGIPIKKGNESHVMDAKLAPIINSTKKERTENTAAMNTIKKKPAEKTKLVESPNQVKQITGNGTIKMIKVKKVYCVPVYVPPGSSSIRRQINHSRPVAILPKPGNKLKVEAPETYSCDACGKRFKTKGGIRSHMLMVHMESARHACPRCTMRFHHYFELVVHLRAHDGKPLTCDLCPKRFRRNKNYAYHLNTHLRERLHSCPVCLRRFTMKEALRGHVARHSPADTFDCIACAEQFPCALDLRRHRETAHGERCLHPCYICSRALQSRTELENHLRGHTNPDIECVFCVKRFTDACKWEEHSAKHIADNAAPYVRDPHVCDVCQKSFMYKSTLATHVAVSHSEQRPLKCGTCSRTFKTRSAQSEHEKAHSRPFACDTCGLRFGRRTTLARHVLVHTGERPHACSHCEASFTQRTTLMQHIRRHHTPTVKRARSKRKTTGNQSKT